VKVAFFRGRHPGIKGWLGVVTKWWTRGPFSHVELIADQSDNTAICWSSAFLDGGVRCKAIVLDAADWITVDVPVTVDQAAAAIEWFKQHAGQPYDVRGLFGFVMRRIPAEKGKWFCSEAVAAALGYAESWRLDPNTLFYVLGRQYNDNQGKV
jgi:uncharacterized protein YycO